MRIPNASEFIPMVQYEVLKLKKIKNDYDKKLKLLQSQIVRYDMIEKNYSKEEPKQANEYSDLCINRLNDLYTLIEDFLL